MTEIPSPFGPFNFRRKNNGPVNEKDIQDAIQKIVNKIEPDIKELEKLLNKSGLPTQIINLAEFKISGEADNPPDDLVSGIEEILNLNYSGVVKDILGVRYDTNRNVAEQIAKLLYSAKKRIKNNLAAKLQDLANQLNS